MQLVDGQHQNWLSINIQPRECIKLEIESKIPGLDIATRTLSIDAPQRQQGDETIDSYESLMLNLMEGDPSLYLHINEVEMCIRDRLYGFWYIWRRMGLG